MRKLLETGVRHFRWIALSLVLVPLVVGVLGVYVLRSYEAIATVWVEPSSTAASSDPTGSKSPADVYASALQQLLLTRAFREEVLSGVVARTGLVVPTPEQHEAWLKIIGSSIKATTRGANLIEIRYRSTNSVVAIGTVAALLDSFQTEMIGMQKQAATREASLYQEQVQQARNDVTLAEQKVASLPPTAPAITRSQAELELSARRDMLQALEERQNTAYSQGVADVISVPGSLQVIDAPRIDGPARASLVDLALAVIGALLVTIAVDLGVVAILAYSDRRVHTASDLATVTDAPVAELPYFAALERGDRFQRLRQRLLHE